ncbi:hypothetical protein DT076_16705 [Desertihabitans brevis]|uniref:Uncharacterized protein n=1 Tax=Desertihabitans brevis TaxID=2268447 RepID=A0A367YRC0_9ACTN|nr:hypothetical protein [Desertihabitans brevis]RCK68287.1 hypothetical protein DT076_16705 [Desertihabitans brevis]
MPDQPEVTTNDNLDVELCGLTGHDWRPHEYTRFNRPHTSWRCVWCHAVACGDYAEADPCWLPYHHREPHRSRNGEQWPIGGNRREHA